MVTITPASRGWNSAATTVSVAHWKEKYDSLWTQVLGLVSVILLPCSPSCQSCADMVYLRSLFKYLCSKYYMYYTDCDSRYNQCLKLPWFGHRDEPWYQWFCCHATLSCQSHADIVHLRSLFKYLSNWTKASSTTCTTLIVILDTISAWYYLGLDTGMNLGISNFATSLPSLPVPHRHCLFHIMIWNLF